jgi:hypothetical protein
MAWDVPFSETVLLSAAVYIILILAEEKRIVLPASLPVA